VAGRTPKARKPEEQLRRRNAPELWTVLPASGCSLKAPAWPLEKASAAESALWRRLWSAPLALWWWSQAIEPSVVARYVRLALSKPEHATVSTLERELGLTPASMLRMRLVVEHPEPKAEAQKSPYAHLRAVEGQS
jgi:hypothetical protein